MVTAIVFINAEVARIPDHLNQAPGLLATHDLEAAFSLGAE